MTRARQHEIPAGTGAACSLHRPERPQRRQPGGRVEHVEVSPAQRPTVTAPDPMTVLVIDDQWAIGSAVASELERDGHEVHVRTSSDTLFDEIEELDPQVVVLHL